MRARDLSPSTIVRCSFPEALLSKNREPALFFLPLSLSLPTLILLASLSLFYLSHTLSLLCPLGSSRGCGAGWLELAAPTATPPVPPSCTDPGPKLRPGLFRAERTWFLPVPLAPSPCPLSSFHAALRYAAVSTAPHRTAPVPDLTRSARYLPR